VSAAVADAAARLRAVDHAGSVLVQAPAGSGKTTLLTQRYLRLLVSVDSPERILALTFTRRAAHEMRERVLTALRAARAAACPPDMNPRTWELAAAANRHLDGLGIDVAHHPARLRIETIDAFNAWLAGQLPISAAMGAPARAQDDVGFLYEEAARRTLAEDDADLFGAAVERVLELDDQRWSRLRDLIIRMLPGRDRWLPLLAGGLEATAALNEDQLRQVRGRFDEDLALLVARGLRRALDCLGAERAAALSAQLHGAARRLESGAAHGAAPGVDHGAGFEAWRHDASVLRSAPQDLTRWRALVRVVLTQRGTVRTTLTKNEGFAPQCADKPVMLDLLAELGRSPQVVQSLAEVAALPEPAYSDAQWERVRGVAQVLMLAAAHLDQVLRERSVADFPAVSLAALRALGTPSAPSELVMRLDYRLQHILFDEFQDTSGAQLELLRLLTQGWQAGDGRSVFCVGDPMQSIYGFRQAEVRAFLELAVDGIGEVRFDVQRLTSNFRSARPLVEWINATFCTVLPRADDPERGAIAYRPSESALPQDPDMEAGVRMRGFAGRAEEARAVAGFIAAQTALHPGWRVAVLVRAKSHAGPIAAALREAAVPFQAVDIEPLADRPVVRDLLSLLRALLHFGDRTAWLAILRAPWTGLRLADLLVVARAGPSVWESLADDSVLRRLSEDGRRRCERLRAVLESAMAADRGSIARWLERTWLELGGPAVATQAGDLDHARVTLARLAQLEARGLPDAARLGELVADLFVRGGGSCAVEIMTIHKAKGLEFDLVVLPGLDRHVSRRNNAFLVLHSFTRAHRDGMVMAARPPVGAADDALFGYLLRQARDAAALEAQRLLYVGCTRARHQLYLTATLGADDAGDPADASDADGASAKGPWSPRPGSLLAVLWPGVGAAFEVDGAVVAAARELRGGPLTRLPAAWSPPPPPAAVGAEVATEDRTPTPVFDWAGETARQVGTLVHAQLQSMTVDATSAAIRAHEPHFQRWLEQRGVPRARSRDAAARVSAALIAVQQDPRGRWILSAAHRDASRELALSGVWRGGLARVVFDRSFIDDGVRWVIDYKTSEHLGGGMEEFLDREVLRYGAQMQRYAALARHLGPEPVRLGLYFPLMRAWREWDPFKT
jgi:ATP-dependent exoDNAse (exonuclease V) beta subunit